MKFISILLVIITILLAVLVSTISLSDWSVKNDMQVAQHQETCDTPTVKTVDSLNIQKANSFDTVKTSNEIHKEVEEIIPLVIWDKHNIKITCLGLEPEGIEGSPELHLMIENNSVMDITISFNNVAINNYMLDPSWSTLITRGNKIVDIVQWNHVDVERCKIDKYRTVDGYFRICDAYSYAILFDTPTIRINFI